MMRSQVNTVAEQVCFDVHLLTGDMLDTMMDPLHLQHFTKLCVLCISTSLYWRMSRWVCRVALAILHNLAVRETKGLLLFAIHVPPASQRNLS